MHENNTESLQLPSSPQQQQERTTHFARSRSITSLIELIYTPTTIHTHSMTVTYKHIFRMLKKRQLPNDFKASYNI